MSDDEATYVRTCAECGAETEFHGLCARCQLAEDDVTRFLAEHCELKAIHKSAIDFLSSRLPNGQIRSTIESDPDSGYQTLLVTVSGDNWQRVHKLASEFMISQNRTARCRLSFAAR